MTPYLAALFVILGGAAGTAVSIAHTWAVERKARALGRERHRSARALGRERDRQAARRRAVFEPMATIPPNHPRPPDPPRFPGPLPTHRTTGEILAIRARPRHVARPPRHDDVDQLLRELCSIAKGTP